MVVVVENFDVADYVHALGIEFVGSEIDWNLFVELVGMLREESIVLEIEGARIPGLIVGKWNPIQNACVMSDDDIIAGE